MMQASVLGARHHVTNAFANQILQISALCGVSLSLSSLICPWTLSSSSLLSSKSGPQSQPCQVLRGPILPDARPLTSSWGTLPSDLMTPAFARAKERPFVSRLVLLALGSRPNPANYCPHGGPLARPPLSHGREESPSVRRVENRAALSCRPTAALRGPLPPLPASSSALLSSVSLCLWVSGAASQLPLYL